MILGFIIPSSDGAAGLAYYAYLYSSYVTYGKVMLWNVFGAGDVLAGYVLYALSPVDPVLNIWLFISKQLNLNILLSYQLLLLCYVFLGGIGGYFLGYKYLFKNKSTALFFAILITISGYMVSNTAIMNFVVAFAWVPICLFFGFESVYKNRIGDYFMLALSISLMLQNYPSIAIGNLAYIFIFLLVIFLFEVKKRHLDKKTIFNSFAFLIFFTIFSIPLSVAYLHYMDEGARYLDNLDYLFYGLFPDLKESIDYMDFQWMFNTFIPNTDLLRWNGYGNGGLFFNSFYYLGSAFPILLLSGVLYISYFKRKLSILTAVTLSTTLTLLYLQGHQILKLIPRLNLLAKYPHFSRPLLIFSFIILASYGFNFLFKISRDKVRFLSRKNVFSFGFLLVPFFSLLILIIFNYLDKDLGEKKYIIYTFSYTLFLGFLYFFTSVARAKKLFLLILSIDLVFFLSSSFPFTVSPHIKTKKNTTAENIAGSVNFLMPKTINYSNTRSYPGMHFGMGSLLYRESAIPQVGRNLFPNRRAYWVEKNIGGEFIKKGMLYEGLSMLGVSRQRYFMANSIYVVSDFYGIPEALTNIYEKARDNHPLYPIEPVVVSRSEPKVINVKNLGLESSPSVSMYDKDIEGYVTSLNIDRADWEKINLLPEDFKILRREPAGQKLIRYEGELPKLSGLITENRFYEKICSVLYDDLNNYYYPINGDIVNFRPPRVGTDIAYSIPYINFYAIYLQEDDLPVLYVRYSQDGETIPSFSLEYVKSCAEDISEDDKVSVKEHKISVPKNKFKFWENYDNTHAVFLSNYLSDGQFPTYFGDEIRRFSVSYLNKSLPWFDNGINENGYMIDVENIKFYNSFNLNPYMEDAVEVSYTTVNWNDNNGDYFLEMETPDRFVLKTNNDDDSMLVTRNIYSKDWVVKIDGAKSETYIINGLYLGANVPKGEHVVEFEYYPFLFKVMQLLMPLYAMVIPVGIVLYRLRNST